jgi:hypothetical protein
MAGVKQSLSDPLAVLILLLIGVILASAGVIDPLAVGAAGIVSMLLLMLLPSLRKLGLVSEGQEYVYAFLAFFAGLFIYGLESKGALPILSLSGNLAIDALTSTVLYSSLVLLVIIGIIVYLYRDRLERVIRR